MRKITLIWIAIVALAVIASVAGTTYYFTVAMRERRRLVVSTTTSLYDTGLLDVIEKEFEKKYPVDLYFISVGTGQAVQHAKRGDADVILVHAPSVEQVFLTEGYGVCRKIIAYNFFVIVGPAGDPAGIKGLNLVSALRKVVEAGRSGNAVWISRGDNSGTHVKEKSLWNLAGFDWSTLKDESWFIESGTGMGKTLLIANERSAYTLSDIGTYLKYYSDGLIGLQVFVSREKELLNVYSVIAVNPEKNVDVNFEDAITFIKFLTSDECQTLIENFKKEEYGRSLFYPAVNLMKSGANPEVAGWIRDYAFFNGSECPPAYRDGHPELYE